MENSEINKTIAIKLFGWEWYDHKTIDKERKTLAPKGWSPAELRQDYDLVPDYCGDITNAFKAAIEMEQKGYSFWIVGRNKGAQYFVRFEQFDAEGEAFDESLSRAICRAALKALGGK